MILRFRNNTNPDYLEKLNTATVPTDHNCILESGACSKKLFG